MHQGARSLTATAALFTPRSGILIPALGVLLPLHLRVVDTADPILVDEVFEDVLVAAAPDHVVARSGPVAARVLHPHVRAFSIATTAATR